MGKTKPAAGQPKKTKPHSKTGTFQPRVTIRMYCHGLGDCFLLRVEETENEFFNVLIDCGIYKASPGAGDIMRRVVAHIAETTGNHLHLLVVTHEHWDHVSGFAQAADLFGEMTIDEVWRAWTENPDDPAAAALLGRFKKSKAALVDRLRAAAARPGAAESQTLDEAFRIMGFFGVTRARGEDGDSDDPYDAIRGFFDRQDKKKNYCEPGQIRTLGETGVKAYVLGPPKDSDAIARDDPGRDGYQKKQSQPAFLGGFGEILEAFPKQAGMDESSKRPFHERYGIPVDSAMNNEFFRTLYGFDDTHPERFRSIDELAFESLSTLALRLDAHINNTSLVLAFELPKSRKVLLFPGDAQAGNWKSWAAPETPMKFEDDKHASVSDLLRRTAFYKVSHHGSHNATPRAYGLELMDNLERAFVPVDHQIALRARYGEMPLENIMNALREKTNDTVFRSDDAPQPSSESPIRWSEEELSLRIEKDGDLIHRPMYCETVFDL